MVVGLSYGVQLDLGAIADVWDQVSVGRAEPVWMIRTNVPKACGLAEVQADGLGKGSAKMAVGRGRHPR